MKIEPEKYEVIRKEWLNKQSRTVSRFYSVYENMSAEKRAELMQDIENLIEYKEVFE